MQPDSDDLLDKVLRLENQASEFGFAWETAEQIMDQIQSECAEIHEHLSLRSTTCDQAALKEEIGDLLHAVFSLCVFCHFNPKDTLDKSLSKFERRLNAVKDISQEQGLNHLKGCSFEQLMTLWRQAKLRVG